MKWGFLILLLLIGLTSCNNATSNSIPLSNKANDSVVHWVDAAKKNLELPFEAKQELLKKADSTNRLINNNSAKAQNLSKISLAYLNISDTANFRKTNKALMALAKEVGDKVAHGEAHWDIGEFLKGKKPDSSYYHYKEAYTIFKDTDLDVEKVSYPGRMLVAMARIRENSKDYIGAEKDVIKAVHEFGDKGLESRLFGTYNDLGIIQNGLMKFDKSIEYHERAREYIKYAPKNTQVKLQLRNKNNIANAYLRKGDHAKAFAFFTELEEEVPKDNKKSGLFAKVLASKAITGFKSNALPYTESVALLDSSDKVLGSLKDNYSLARNKQYRAELHLTEKDTASAIAQAISGKELALSSMNNDRLLSLHKLLTKIDKGNSSSHANAYFNLSEALQLQERAIQDKFARIQMETDEVIEENESLAKRTELLAGISIGLLVLGIGIFTIISQRISNQRLKFKQGQQESNQEIYNLMLAQHGKLEEGKKSEQRRVSEELHDGILGQMLGIRLILSGLNERNDPSAMEQRAELISKLQELEEEIRTISHELNTASYQKVHNFILSLKDLIGTVEKSSKVSIQFEYDENFEWDTLDGNVKINSYRVIQELLQNCVKHARCNSAVVTFQINNNLLNLMVEDDGVGFDNTKSKKGIGLRNIISRVKKMGAKLEINSHPGKGTKVSIAIPNLDLKMESPKLKELRTSVLETKTAS